MSPMSVNLQKVYELKFVVITLDQNLKFNKHINNIRNKLTI